MNLSAAKAFNGFILEAKNAFDRVFNREVTEEELEQIKVSYSGDEFERIRAEFDAELLHNYTEYREENVISNYIHITLSDVRYLAFSININYEIIQIEWETAFLLKLKKDIENQIDLVKLFYEFNSDFEHYELMYYCQQLEASDKSVDEQDKLISVANIPPTRDSRFEFELLLKECYSIENITDRIKLITKRLFEFEQWKLLNEKVDEAWGYLITDYSKMYYPNFEKLCKIEIEKLQKLDAIEKSAQATNIPEKQSVSTETVVQSASDYVWKSSATDMLELITALYQNKSIERRDGKLLTRKEITEYFQQMFDIEITDIEGKLNKATNRKINQTPFLNNLAVQFVNYAEGKEAKMQKRR